MLVVARSARQESSYSGEVCVTPVSKKRFYVEENHDFVDL